MGAGATLRGLVLASHPGPTAVVTALSAALVVGVGGRPATVALVTAAVLTGQLSIGWSNDWVDARRDTAVRRADKPVVAGLVSAGQLRAAALAALTSCVALSLAVGLLPGAVHIVAVASAWAYNVRLKASAWSWFPFALSFGLLPAFLVLSLPGRPLPAAWAVAAGALLGTGAHVANVLPDLEDDHRTGVRGLPHRWGRTTSSVVAPAVLVAAVLVVVLGPDAPPGAFAVAGAGVAVVLAVTAGVVALSRHRSRLPFRLSMAVAALCVVLLVGAGPEMVSG